MSLWSLPFFCMQAYAPSVPLCGPSVAPHSFLSACRSSLLPHLCLGTPQFPSMHAQISTPQSPPSFLCALHPNHASPHAFKFPLFPSGTACRSPQTHSVHFQALSDALHSYPAAFISSPFPSFCSLETPLLSSLDKQIFSSPSLTYSSILHFPLYAPRSPLFPSLNTQISSVPFSICSVLASPLCAHSHLSFP